MSWGLAERSLKRFGEFFEPAEAAEPILPPAVRAALLEWLTEIWAAEELKAVGIAPRRRAIFDGPPGVGKTTLAHHLAARLGLPMLAVRPEAIQSKWVNETGENIGRLFDLARSAEPPILLFLDEFDAYSRQRRKGRQAAEDHDNAAVDVLLQRLEQFDGFLIAATNFGDQIDQAMWRRFDIHMTLELPGQKERERILERYLAPYGLPAPALRELAAALDTASPALIRQLCEGLKRQIVIGPKLKADMRREAVLDRILVSVHPHKDLGKPRLWSHGSADRAVHVMPWPLPKACDLESAAEDEVQGGADIVTLPRRGGAA